MARKRTRSAKGGFLDGVRSGIMLTIGHMTGRRSSPLSWWNVVGIFLGVFIIMVGDVVQGMRLPPIYWNSTNAMFKASNNDHVIEVKLYDDIDFVCPYFTAETEDLAEYYLIYQVSKREYDDCNLYPNSNAIMIVNCSSPVKKKRFTILFEPFQSIPHVPDYKPGSRYYFISTSTGKIDGIANPHQGACAKQNMKLTIEVCCQTSTPPPPSNSTTTTSTTLTSTTPPDTSEGSTSTTTITTVPSSSSDVDVVPVNPKHRTTEYPDREKPPDKTKDPKDKDKENEINDPEHQGLINRASSNGCSAQTLLTLLVIFHVLRWQWLRT